MAALYGLAIITAVGVLVAYYTTRRVWPLLAWICLVAIYLLTEFAGAAMFIYDPPQGMTLPAEKTK
ncbi:MAG: hypothetical protein ACTHPD_05755 [Rhizomicrobium sp.]